VLEDGSRYAGEQFGCALSVAGEVVFNTGMVGYPESMTDPSYAGQILVLTYPLVGNYGVPVNGQALPKTDGGLPIHLESDRIHVKALVVSRLAHEYSHWAALDSLSAWMSRHNVPGITGIDTRALTKRLREKGCMLGKVVVRDTDVAWDGPNARNIVAEVSTPEPRLYPARGDRKVILVDLGAKNNITRSLNRRGISVLDVPWDYDWTGEEADGIVVSNGPGDPKKCTETISVLRSGLDRDIPVFGICLGHQLLALAAGGDTYKLKYGHRSQNQPCVEVGTKRCYITSQNHGYAVNEQTLGEMWKPWFFNANDGTNEGLFHRSGTKFSVQFHPEASPGPSDTEFLFDRFIETMDHARQHA
jgi:carbamoyl-phosphate synthase small subunit